MRTREKVLEGNGRERVSRVLLFAPEALAELQIQADAERGGDMGAVLSAAMRESCRTFRNRTRRAFGMSARAAKAAREKLAELDAQTAATE